MNKFIDKAKQIVDDTSRFKKLENDAGQKFERLDDDDNKISQFIDQLKLFIRMVKMHFSGKYSAFSAKSILIMIAGLVYFVTPVDLIPDFIPALGFTDDITVIFFIYRSLRGDIEEYIAWETRQNPTQENADS
ncbi:MAG: YkvA family protein [Bacteroidota bacterium]